MPGKTTVRRAARTLGASGAAKSSVEVVSTRKAVLQALSASGPMRARDIVQAVAARDDVPLHGKTPRKSIEARIAEMAERGEIKQVSRGVYRVDKRRAKRVLANA